MKIAIMATGGVGAVFGAELLEAGADVYFIARGEHLRAIRDTGLMIAGDESEKLIKNVQATDDPEDVGTVDIILFAVKLWDTETAAELCKPMLGPNTILIPLQNGVASTESIAKIVGKEQTGRGLSRVSASIDRPGVIRRVGTFGSLAFAEANGEKSPRLENFLEICKSANIDAEVPKDIFHALWQKFVLLVAVSGMTTAARHPMRSLIRSQEGLLTAVSCMTEVAEVGRAHGIDLPGDTVTKLTEFIQKMPPAMKASQAIDLENGRRLEAPWLTGSVCDMGRKFSIPTPINDALYSVIKPYVMGSSA